jgi:hypothetical protein
MHAFMPLARALTTATTTSITVTSGDVFSYVLEQPEPNSSMYTHYLHVPVLNDCALHSRCSIHTARC